MIRETVLVYADTFLPYRNQAVEEYLLRGVGEGSCILYLWQNRRTVVIGRNQNCLAECKVSQLEQDGGHLARRLSGGGAVFHDLGNLNFSFIAADPDYDIKRQQQVILRAISSLGLSPELTGRNDICIDGRKFSGNAFISSGKRHCHHGTLMICADTSDMSGYLNVDMAKLESKGVRSVRARVVNLAELDAGITVDRVKNALREAFAFEYGLTPREIKPSELDSEKLNELTLRFASDEWRLGAEPDCSIRLKKRFLWGMAELCLGTEGNRVKSVAFFTDSLDSEIADAVNNALCGVTVSAKELTHALLRSAENAPQAQKQALRDISTLMTEVD